ncbi:hypothetical protein CSC62_07430 [Pseudoxanthomonas jiangsuensis]|uniref:hypothetical protein n=1 Tax=Pseudoxanthomonas jiangsuensis TaxID=619688 RepID=UPI001391918B|nr:hypothetical protein [Pseudoxanthomonas jiangsuensis]KAF1697970.1 hypothetical protein CSC62_07430 [Pseudoxanthomonas jiangsuensis]
MAAIIHLPADVARFHAGLDAVRHRAREVGATPERRRLAMQTLLAEMRAGRSSGAAVALANSAMAGRPLPQQQGGAA